jgi:hypothetical protein
MDGAVMKSWTTVRLRIESRRPFTIGHCSVEQLRSGGPSSAWRQ